MLLIIQEGHMLYRKDNEDKINLVNRCIFDADHGWLTLSLERLYGLHQDFQSDPQVDYAEALIRKDFLGQGLEAEKMFLKAQADATNRSHSNENYLFSTFNAAKHARNEVEFRKQSQVAMSLAPNDPDVQFFNSKLNQLDQGIPYTTILIDAVSVYQANHKWGDCASFAEIALQAGNLSLADELALRETRMTSLRELDKAADESRRIRGESFPPEERLALQEAIQELDRTLSLDEYDHKLWNWKSAWLYLMNRYEDSLIAADRAIDLCPDGYLKPKTNKAMCLARLSRKEEARDVIEQLLIEAESLGPEFETDLRLAQQIEIDLQRTLMTKDEELHYLSKQIVNSAYLASQQELNRGECSDVIDQIQSGLERRVGIAGKLYNKKYVALIEEMLVFFSSATVCFCLLNLSQSLHSEYRNCLYALLYISARYQGILQRDACRTVILSMLSHGDPDIIRKEHREIIMGTAKADPEGFALLENNIRNELSKYNPSLIPLFADQSPLSTEEINNAKTGTMAGFFEDVSRNAGVSDSHSLKQLFKKLGGRI